MAEPKVKSQPSMKEGVNIQVAVRCRPPSEAELRSNNRYVTKCNDKAKEIVLEGSKSFTKTYHFDQVFGPNTSQDKVYRNAVSPLVKQVMEGFNCTVFAYGQTGTGKTFTMEGVDSERQQRLKSAFPSLIGDQAGVIPRAVEHIFQQLDEMGIDAAVKASFVELYNEELTDLLTLGDDRTFDRVDNKPRLRLMEDKNGVVIQGLEEIPVKTISEIYDLLDRGTARRKTAETHLNKQSSRSHSIFSVTIQMQHQQDGDEIVKVGKLNLVDLAGSENISRSGAKDNRAREAGNINQSLLTLGRVINALVDNLGHIPYRDSKLTRMLRDSLGGRTRTCMIATISPMNACLEETINTLDYAYRTKNIRNRPEINQKITKAQLIKELNSEIDRLKVDLFAAREKHGVFLTSERLEEIEGENETMRKKLSVIEDVTNRALDELREANDTLQEQLTEAERTKSQLTRQVEGLESDLYHSQQAHARTDMLLESYREAGQALAIMSHNMGTYGRARDAEVSRLQAALVESAARADRARDAVEQYQGAVRIMVGGVEQQMVALQTLGGERLTLLSKGLDDSQVAAKTQLALAQEGLRKMCEVVEAQRKAASKLVADLAAADDAGGQKLAALLQEQTAGVARVCAESSAAVEGALQSLVAGQVDELRGQLDAFARKWRGEAAATGAAIVSTYEDIKSRVDQVAECHREGAEDVGGKLEQLLVGGKRKWGEVVEQQEAQQGELLAGVEAAVKEMQEKVSGLIMRSGDVWRNGVLEQWEETARGAEGVVEAVGSAREHVQGKLGEATVATQTKSQEVSALWNNHTASISQLTETATEFSTKVNQAAGVVAGVVKEQQGRTEKHAQGMLQAMQSHSTSTQDQRTSLRSAGEGHLTATCAQGAEEAQQQSTVVQQSQQHTATVLERVRESVQEWVEQVASSVDPNAVEAAEELPDEEQIRAILPDEGALVEAFNTRMEEEIKLEKAASQVALGVELSENEELASVKTVPLLSAYVKSSFIPAAPPKSRGSLPSKPPQALKSEPDSPVDMDLDVTLPDPPISATPAMEVDPDNISCPKSSANLATLRARAISDIGGGPRWEVASDDAMAVDAKEEELGGGESRPASRAASTKSPRHSPAPNGKQVSQLAAMRMRREEKRTRSALRGTNGVQQH